MLLVFGSCLFSLSSAAQVSASFKVQTLPANTNVTNIVSADLNGDGVPDLIETYNRVVPNGFSVQLALGNGTFSSPVTYTFPVQNQSPTMITTADVNGDGKTDVIAAINPFTTGSPGMLLVYLGLGNGTLASPRKIPLQFFINFLAPADFNHDGKVDLALGLTNSSQTADYIAVVYGNGSGAFTAPATIFSPGSNHGISALALGDFDADSHADIAVGVTNCNASSCQSTDVDVLYGNGAGSFTLKKVFSGAPGVFQFSSGDLNLDGRTDLVGVVPRVKVLALYGQTSRTVVAQSISAPNAQGGLGVITDLNGDGHNDFATLATTTSGAAIDLFLANGKGGFAAEQFPVTTNTFVANGELVVGDFNRDRKPDLLFAGTTNNGSNSTLLYELLNTTANTHFSSCSFPNSAAGIHVCTPPAGSSDTSPVRFTIAAAWFEPMRKIELWVDGVKLAEQYNGWDKDAWFDFTHSFSPGTHQANIFTAGYDNTLQHTALSFTVP